MDVQFHAMYVSVAAGLNSSALVVITPVAEPIAGTVKNRTATTEAATVLAARFNVRIGVPLSLVFDGETYYQDEGCATGEPGPGPSVSCGGGSGPQ